MLFPFNTYCITSSSVLRCSFFFFVSSSALPAFTLLLRFLSLLFSLPLWSPLSLTHFTLAFSLFIWLCHLLCHLRPLLQTPPPISLSPPPHLPRTRWLSSWFLSSYQFVCQVGTGDAAGCTLTSLCHFHSSSHQVCLRRCLSPRGSFQAGMSYMEKTERAS